MAGGWQEHASVAARFVYVGVFPLENLNIADAMKLGASLWEAGNFEDCEKVFRAVADVDPENQYAIHGVGACLMEMYRPTEAMPWFDRAYGLLYRDMMGLMSNRARAVGDAGDAEGALVLFENLLKQEPNNAHFLLNRGLMLLQMRKYKAAVADMEAVLAIEPNNDKARFGRGFARLVQGDFASGFEDYEYRMKYHIDPIDAPEWTGAEDVDGKTVLVHEDMGLGDNIMFMRYVPMLRDRGARVVVVISDNVRPLVPEGVEVVGFDRTTWPKLDYWVRFMSLAWCFRTTLDTVPAPVRVNYDPFRLARWQDVIGRGDALKVGLCWTGSPKSIYDAQRTIPLARLAPLFDVRGVKFFSLQKDVRPSDEAEFNRLPMVNIASQFETYADTAAAMNCLDLVITVDTSVAHMAGTVGVPTWVMLTNYRSYWVWAESQISCPWYASARVFRQTTDGDWDSVVLPIRDRLASIAQPKALTG